VLQISGNPYGKNPSVDLFLQLWFVDDIGGGRELSLNSKTRIASDASEWRISKDGMRILSCQFHAKSTQHSDAILTKQKGKKMKKVFLACALIGGVSMAAVGSASAVVAPSDTVTVTVRAECRKTSDRGCTAHNLADISAPAGRYMIPDSLTVGTVVGTNNRGGYRPLCGMPVAVGTVPYQIPETDVIAYLYTSAKAPLHVESGGGYGDLKQVFYVNCQYTFRTGTIPHAVK
jgi:hypothetical protein